MKKLTDKECSIYHAHCHKVSMGTLVDLLIDKGVISEDEAFDVCYFIPTDSMGRPDVMEYMQSKGIEGGGELVPSGAMDPDPDPGPSLCGPGIGF
jgi:hypothetical protein